MAPATYTYTIHSYDGNGLELGNHFAPAMPRPNGKLWPAAEGVAFLDDDGNLVLMDAVERPVLDDVPGCGFLCNPNDTFVNQNVPSWGSVPVIFSGTGGTATISEI